MLLYYGSEYVIKKPEFGRGKPYNDYGRGFYCTEDLELAKEWAVDAERDGYVNCYDIDISCLRVVDLDGKGFCILHWIAVLLANRHFELETPLSREAYRYLQEHFRVEFNNTDIIMGYRADDSYFAYAQDFVNGLISISQLSRAMHLGLLGKQVMIRSRKAFNKLKYVSSEAVFAKEWYDRKMARDMSARREYSRINKEDYVPGGLYIVHIIDGEVKADDPRLQ